MLLISIDIGLRNFAWCTMVRSPCFEDTWKDAPFLGNSITIHDWNVDDVVKLYAPLDELISVNLNQTDIATIVPWFVSFLELRKKELCPPGLDLALIEAQPTGHVLPGGKSISNIKTKVLSHLLQAFYIQRKVPVKFVSPASKLKYATEYMSDKAEYSAHKKGAKLLTEACISKCGTEWADFWFKRKGKKDDLADAFLQGVCADLELKREKKHTQAKKKRRNAVINLPLFEEEED
jgi:hypothetical protein